MSLYLTAMKNYLGQPKDEENHKPNALILIAGATGGADEGFKLVAELKNSYNLLVVASQKALAIYGEENLKSLTGSAKIINGENFSYELLKTTSLVYLPVISANLVGKLAHGIYDEPLASIIFHAKLAGKPVIGVVDGALPDGDGFTRRGFVNPPSGLVKLLRENIKRVLEQEILLVEAAKIQASLAPFLNTSSKTAAQPTRTAINKRIVTREDLLNYENLELTVPKRAIITDLAREYAAQKNIKFIFVE